MTFCIRKNNFNFLKFIFLAELFSPVLSGIMIRHTSIQNLIGLSTSFLVIIAVFMYKINLLSFERKSFVFFISFLILINLEFFYWIKNPKFDINSFINTYFLFFMFLTSTILLIFLFSGINKIDIDNINNFINKIMLFFLVINSIMILLEAFLFVSFKYVLVFPWQANGTFYRFPGFFTEPSHVGEYFLIYSIFFVKAKKIKSTDILNLVAIALSGSLISLFSIVFFLIKKIQFKKVKNLVFFVFFVFLFIFFNFNMNPFLTKRMDVINNGSFTIRFYKTFYVLNSIRIENLLNGYGFAQENMAIKSYSGKDYNLFVYSGGYFSGIGTNIIIVGIILEFIFEIFIFWLFFRIKRDLNSILNYMAFMIIRLVTNINFTMFIFWIVVHLLIIDNSSSRKNYFLHNSKCTKSDNLKIIRKL